MLTLVSGCGGGPLSFLTGGGPNVAANVQAGQTNRQSAVSVEQQAPQPRLSFGLGSTVSGVTQTTEQSQIKADSVGVINQGLLWWQWIILGMLIPGPLEWFLAWRLSRKK